jgi:hypothetical protein
VSCSATRLLLSYLQPGALLAGGLESPRSYCAARSGHFAAFAVGARRRNGVAVVEPVRRGRLVCGGLGVPPSAAQLVSSGLPEQLPLPDSSSAYRLSLSSADGSRDATPPRTAVSSASRLVALPSRTDVVGSGRGVGARGSGSEWLGIRRKIRWSPLGSTPSPTMSPLSLMYSPLVSCGDERAIRVLRSYA